MRVFTVLHYITFLVFTKIEKTHSTYERLDEEEKEKVRTILYIMDKFSISLEGYHELSQVDKSLPRTHLIESCTKAMDQKWDIKRTPGTAQCAELPFKVLLKKEIREHVSNPSISFFFSNEENISHNSINSHTLEKY